MELAGITLILLVSTLLILERISNLSSRVKNLTRLEAKVDLLLKQAGLTYEPLANLAPNIVEAIKKGEKITAIKLYRDATGAGIERSQGRDRGRPAAGGHIASERRGSSPPYVGTAGMNPAARRPN